MNIIDDDKRFEINVSTRDVKYAGEDKVRLIQGDHNSERITFAMDRYVENHDMSNCDKVEIHFINVNLSTKEKSEDVYTVKDVTVGASDGKIIFSWKVSGSATRYEGNTSFIIKFINIDEDNNVIYSWNTAINKEIHVGEGMNCGENLDEDYSDILEQWKEEVISDLVAITEKKLDDLDVVKTINELDEKMEVIGDGELKAHEQYTIIDALNLLYKARHFRIYYAALSVTDDNALAIDCSLSFDDFQNLAIDGQQPILSVRLDGKYYIAHPNVYDFAEEFSFTFTDNNKHYTLIYDVDDGWSGYVTELAKSEYTNGELKTSEQTIVGAINELASYAHITPYKATVSANDDNTLTIDSAPDFYLILLEREGYNSEVILDVTMGDNKYVAYPSLISTNDEGKFGFTFTDHNNKEYTLLCDVDDGWSGYVTEFARAEDVAAELAYKQPKNYYINCKATSNEDNTLTVTSSVSFDWIAGGLSDGATVVLFATIDNNRYDIELLSQGAPFRFVVTDNNKHYTIICDVDDGWSGYVTEFARAEDITSINSQIGDIETLLGGI